MSDNVNRTIPAGGFESINALCEHLGIQDWDALLIGDGSGSGWTAGAGWATVLIDRYSRTRKLFYGGINAGTVTVAEFMPYLHAMAWYTRPKGIGKLRRRDAAHQGRSVSIHIVTDSKVIATSGNHPGSRKAYAELWACMDAYQRNGYTLRYHHVPRDVVHLNTLVDEISRQARLAIEDVYTQAVTKLRSKYPGIPDDVTIYDFSH